jgi:hypothetical protein
MKRSARLLCPTVCLSLAACAPSVDTANDDADRIIDMVVYKESYFTDCVEVGPQSAMVEAKDGYQGGADLVDAARPLGFGLYVDAFSNEAVVQAAKEVAVDYHSARTVERQTEGERRLFKFSSYDDDENCMMVVSFPLFTDRHAFVDFISPGGTIGVYAFERTGNGWRVAERVHQGWW